MDARPCGDCGAPILFAQRVVTGKWRAFDAVPLTDDRRAFAHVLIDTQAWRHGDLVEHFRVRFETTEEAARLLAADYPHHLLHQHTTTEGTPD